MRFGGVKEASSPAGDTAHAGGGMEDEEDKDEEDKDEEDGLELAARACLKAREVKQYLRAAQENVEAKERAVVGAEVLLRERARQVDALKQEVSALQHQVDALKHAVEEVCPRVCMYACAPLYVYMCVRALYVYICLRGLYVYLSVCLRVPFMYTYSCAFVLYVVCLSGASEGHTHTHSHAHTHTHTHTHSLTHTLTHTHTHTHTHTCIHTHVYLKSIFTYVFAVLLSSL